WGGVNGFLPPLDEIRTHFKPKTAPTRTYDQYLLREVVWPSVKDSIMIHDSVYTGCLDSIPFPPYGDLGPKRHVGQNEIAVIDKAKVLETDGDKLDSVNKFFVFGMNKSGTTFLQSLFDSHPEANCPSEHSFRSVKKSVDQVADQYQKVLENFDKNTARQGVMFDSEKLKQKLYWSWVEDIFSQHITDDVKFVGINDNTLDEHLGQHANKFPDAKFVNIIRDPRDLVHSIYYHRKRVEANFDDLGIDMDRMADSVAQSWVKKIRSVQAFNKSHPGRVEIVRYEDLIHPERRVTNLRRVFQFIGLSASVPQVEEIFSHNELDDKRTREVATMDKSDKGFYRKNKTNWKDELTSGQVEKVEAHCAELMKLLNTVIDGHP
ncbi:MAG: sulfotransferase domain-containing protein, partial [Verrucomicrobiota bacterium]